MHQSELVEHLGQACVGIVLTEQDAVFGTRGEHAVGLIHALRREIVNQYADVRLVALQHHRIASGAFQRGIDTRHQALTGRLFVPRGAVDLTGDEQSGNDLALERVLELRRVEVIVLDGVAGPVGFDVA